jgi:hypothetical protein
MNNFHKLTNNLFINWRDLDLILNSITLELSNEVNSPEVYVLDDPTSPVYWQYYPKTRTRFTRNFGRTFVKASKQVVNHLALLQQAVRQENFSDQKMYEAFVNHKFDYKRVQLSKISSGIGVLPHIDNGREYVINIGLKNSNTCKTYIADTSVIKGFRQRKLESFIMQDNEAYIINVDKAHAVKTLVTEDDKLDRYIISYMLTEPLNIL